MPDVIDVLIPTVVAEVVEEIKNQCQATRRDGERCKRHAMLGQNICPIHGGKAPQNIRAAKKRLLEMAGTAMLCLQNAMENGDIKEQTSAATKVLDRAGLGPNITVDITDKKEHELSHLDDEALADKAEALALELRERND